jgi:carbonic anhydrase
MEVHFVHLRQGALPCDPDALLVIGARIQKSEHAHAELNKIFGLPLPENTTAGATSISNFDLNKVLPDLDGSWRYLGSLTAPASFSTCSAQGGSIDEQLSADIFPENVSWTLLTKPVGMSSKQIDAFRKIFELGNSRPTQPLNSRVILQDKHHD